MVCLNPEGKGEEPEVTGGDHSAVILASKNKQVVHLVLDNLPSQLVGLIQVFRMLLHFPLIHNPRYQKYLYF